MNFHEEISALLSKAERFISSAALLKEHEDFESAASRLYYAMFFCAEALLLTKGLAYSKHASVIAAFGQHFVRTGQLPADLHRWLINAFDKRQVADYEAKSVLTKGDIETMQQQAQQFLSIARQFLQRQGWL